MHMIQQNFLPGLSFVHCLFDSCADYGSFPHMALFWPHASQENKYPGKCQFHKNMGFSLSLKAQVCTDTEHIPNIKQAL